MYITPWNILFCAPLLTKGQALYAIVIQHWVSIPKPTVGELLDWRNRWANESPVSPWIMFPIQYTFIQNSASPVAYTAHHVTSSLKKKTPRMPPMRPFWDTEVNGWFRVSSPSHRPPAHHIVVNWIQRTRCHVVRGALIRKVSFEPIPHRLLLTRNDYESGYLYEQSCGHKHQ